MGSSTKTVDAKIPNATEEEKRLYNLVENYDKLSSNQASDLITRGYNGLTSLDGNTPDFTALGTENQSRLDEIYKKYSELYEGKLNPNYQSNMEKSIQSSYENSLGSSLNSLSNRGVLNSKVTNTAINSQQKNLANAMASAFQSNINTEASLLKGQSDLSSQKLDDANKALTGQLVLPTTYYTIGGTLQDSVNKDWATMYNNRYKIATPAQTVTTGSVLGGLVSGLASGVGAYYGSACFAYNTLISMADGTYKMISDVVSGDRVLSYDFKNKKIVSAMVGDALSPKISESQYIKLDFGDFDVLTTASQSFYVDGEWVLASDLIVADNPFGDADNYMIRDIVMVDDKELVYDLFVNGSNTYFANGLLVLGGDVSDD